MVPVAYFFLNARGADCGRVYVHADRKPRSSRNGVARRSSRSNATFVDASRRETRLR
jgi:hypothetical protein